MDRANQGPRNKGRRVTRNKGPPIAARKLLVQKANQKKEVLTLCKDDPMTHNIGEVQYSVEHSTSVDTEQNIKDWLLDLTRENVKELYLDSGWGWSDAEKGDELWHSMSQYLIVRNSSTSELLAFTHFRFDMDYGSHVLYCYELQVSSSVQGSGLGAWLMQLLHTLARSCNMSKVVLTVGRNNPRALKFYFEMGYRIDETSLATLNDTSSGSYLILSRPCKSNKDEGDSKPTVSKKQQTISSKNSTRGGGKEKGNKKIKKSQASNSDKENELQNTKKDKKDVCEVETMQSLKL
uniref:N-alpha-acetyltransferase 40 n=1 Tax=Hirondellea gigas TaxID=1518452 RepID=A0A2P2I266_9CRUS